ncbi:MAG: FAD-binding oxidoreductase [Proteobacteria bacterium]|nr:MAG: FAD-binding oxidoreductase [Pseudomonadota bacterium]
MPSNTLLHINDPGGGHAPSWYAATARGVPTLDSLEGDVDCDVAVVGAGYSGLSCALHLAERGYRVVVLEAHRVGWGASGRNGGQVGTGQRLEQDELERLVGETLARQAWDIAEQAKSLVRDLIRRHEIPCDYKPGCLHANHRRRFDNHTRRYVEFLNGRYDYADIRYVAPAEMREMVGTADYSGGSLDMGAGHLHPLNFALGIARAAIAAGATIYERSEVLEVVPGDPVRLRTASGAVRAAHVVYACNGYLGGLEPTVSDRVMPINNFIIATEPLGDDLAAELIRDDVCVADSRFVINYYRLSADRRLLFGGGENYGYRFPRDIKSFVRRPMLAIYPQLAGRKIEYGWGGTLAITMSRLPHFERLGANRLSIAGYSGSGVALATCAGAIAAEAVDGVAGRFDVMNALPTPRFPGGSQFRGALLALAMTWYALRDRL